MRGICKLCFCSPKLQDLRLLKRKSFTSAVMGRCQMEQHPTPTPTLLSPSPSLLHPQKQKSINCFLGRFNYRAALIMFHLLPNSKSCVPTIPSKKQKQKKSRALGSLCITRKYSTLLLSRLALERWNTNIGMQSSVQRLASSSHKGHSGLFVSLTRLTDWQLTVDS